MTSNKLSIESEVFKPQNKEKIIKYIPADTTIK